MQNEETNSIPYNLYELTTKGPVLYVRHAETDYNVNSSTIPKELLRDKPQFIDCNLTDKGRKQAEDLSKRLTDLRIRYVFCSPLYRCLETTFISLQNHPDRENFSIIVIPFINEIVSGVGTYSKNIRQKQKIFSKNSPAKFDWSYFNSLFQDEDDRETYFLNYVDNFSDEEVEVKNLLERTKLLGKSSQAMSLNETNDVDPIKQIFTDYELSLAEFSRCFVEKKKSPESLQSVYNRNIKFKNYLKDFLKNLANDEKILVITHSSFTKISTSRLANEMVSLTGFPSDCYKPSNCEIITINIEI